MPLKTFTNVPNLAHKHPRRLLRTTYPSVLLVLCFKSHKKDYDNPMRNIYECATYGKQMWVACWDNVPISAPCIVQPASPMRFTAMGKPNVI